MTKIESLASRRFHKADSARDVSVAETLAAVEEAFNDPENSASKATHVIVLLYINKADGDHYELFQGGNLSRFGQDGMLHAAASWAAAGYRDDG